MSEKIDEKESTEKSHQKENKPDITSKMPDLSGIVNKINLDKILGSIKSMINPEESASPSMKADPNDDLGMKVIELSALLQEISKTHAKLSRDFSKANDLLSGLFKDLENIRSHKETK